MKKSVLVFILFVMITVLSGCKTKNAPDNAVASSSDLEADVSQSAVTEQMAYDGVSNYCHTEYDWSIAKDNPDIMGITMGEETESEYQVIFSSYTGSFVYFYVDKESGTTRMVEHVPALNIEEEAGTINLYDYLKSDEK